MPRKAAAYTQFMYHPADSMILRSGKTINGCCNAKIVEDARALGDFDNTKNTPQYGYCKVCFSIFGLFDFLEKYHKNIRGEEKTIHGADLNYWLVIYNISKNKIDEFINTIDKGDVVCECDKQNYKLNGILVNNFWLMDSMSKKEKYSKMANYTGYGVEREKYRIYHKNFFIIERVYEDYIGDELHEEYYITRDFQKAKKELLHWQKYFSQEHQSVIDTAEKGLKKIFNNDDLVGEVTKFLKN